jgi:hypothetical protein
VLRGWQLRSREKGVAKIGPAKRGKGTKWMVLVDGGAGTPLAGFALEALDIAVERFDRQMWLERDSSGSRSRCTRR